MKKQSQVPFSFIKLINVVLVVIPFILVWFLYYEPLTVTVHSYQSSVLLLMGYAVMFYLFCMKLDGFYVSIARIGDLALSQIISVGVSDVFAALGIWMLSPGFPNLLPGLACFALQCVICVISVIAAQKYFFKVNKPYKAVVIYDVRQGMEELVHTYGLQKRYDVQKVYAIEEVLEKPELIKYAEVVFMYGIHSHERNIVLKQCIESDQRVYLIPRVGDVVMSSAERMHMFHLPMLRVKRYQPSMEFRIIKRAFDILVSGLGLIVLSPVFLIVSLMVRSDGGPALYKQVRLTKDGKQFKILKFRSMRVDAEKYSGAVLSAGENDPRITKIGRVIRACRLDEIPQLWNIFVGEMSIVGPRPERPEIASEYVKELPEFNLRLQAKAGLTGYAQVYGKYNTTPYDKLLMDLMYIAHPSLFEDLTIMMATVKILFSKDSTEGIAEGASNAMDSYAERQKSKKGA